MLDVVAHPLFEVGIVGPDLDVMVIGDERALHEPRLVGRAGHHGQRVRRHDPLEVRRHIVALDRQDELVVQVVVHRNMGFGPLRRIFGTGRRDACIAALRTEIHAHETLAVGTPRDRQPENRLVQFLTERDIVAQEDEMAHLVEVQQHRIGVVATNGPALDDRRHVGNRRHVPGNGIPQQTVAEPAGELERIEEIGRLNAPAELVVAQRTQPSGAGNSGPGGEFVVIIRPAADILPVGTALRFGKHPVQARLQQTFRRNVTSETPQEPKQLDLFVVENTVQTVHRQSV